MTKLKSRLGVFTPILVLFALFFVVQAAVPPFPQAVTNHMATRQMRYHHYMWHQVRENWNKFPAETKAAFAKIGWTPPNPARTFDPVTGEAAAVLDNYSGEDFLYMHRQMIKTANDLITQNQPSYGRIQGWKTIPAPGDPDYPVPANYTVPNNAATTSSTNNRKTDNYYTRTILPNERLFKDPVQLKNMTLNELGSRIEVTIHSYLHMRWSAANPIGYRNTFRGTIPMIDKKWDNIAYDWLGDSYSSHVNPLFWKIHGWVNDRIEDWRLANNLTSIRWRGFWVGGPMANLSSVINAKQTSLRGGSNMDMSGDGDQVGDIIEQAMQVFLDSGVPEANFSEDVALPPIGSGSPEKQEDGVGDVSEEAMDIWLNSGVPETNFNDDVDLPPIGSGSSEKQDDGVGDVSEEAMDIWLGSGVKEHSFGEDVDLPPIGWDSHSKPKHCKKKAI